MKPTRESVAYNRPIYANIDRLLWSLTGEKRKDAVKYWYELMMRKKKRKKQND